MGKFTEYIGSQFGNPRGVVGKLCCLIMNRMNRAMYKSVVALVPLDQQSTMLDIGYGNGYLIQKLYQKSDASIYGIDISDDMKLAAEGRNKKAVAQGKVHLFTGDCCQLDFKDKTFEAVTSVNTIYFWDDTKKAVSEIYRVLKPGGVFYNAVYSKEWLQKLSYTRNGFCFFDKEELALLGKQAGFSSVTIKDIAHGKNYIVQYKK